METTTYNVQCPQGADWEDGIVVINAVTGAEIDVSAWSAELQGRTAADAPSAFAITEAASASGQISLGADGFVRWRVAAEAKAAFAAGTRVAYDLLLTSPTGRRYKPVRGTHLVTEGVTP